MSDQAVTITFPDLSPAEASQLAAEFEAEMKRAGASATEVHRQRASADSQDLGSILILAGSVAGPYLIELAKHAGKEFVGGFANESGKIAARRVMGYLLKKWNTRATIVCTGQSPVTIGDASADRGPRQPPGQGTRLQDLKTLGVVLIGASEFPHFPKEISSKAFARSATLARESLETRTIFRDVLVEDLFDKDIDPEALVDRIEKFADAHADMQDIVLYYCGHGEFLPEQLGRHYYLLLKGTRPTNPQRSGLVLNEFTYLMDNRPALSDRRFYVMLDSCFAGAAVEAFQGGADAAIGQQLASYAPPKGWALFAASDKKHPAMGADGAGATMFMGGVSDVLTGKAPGTPARLTLSDLAEATQRHLARKHGSGAVLPQCHSVRQADGDVSRIPIFWTGTTMPIRIEKGAEAQVAALELEARRIWPSVENSTIISVLEDFQRKYASTPYASMAAARIAEVQRIEVERKRREDSARVGKGGPAASGAPMFLGFKAHSPAELARELTKDPAHWKEARDWWPKRATEVQQWVLHDLGYREVAEQLDAAAKASGSADGSLFRAHRALAPKESPRFLGRALTVDELKQLAVGVRSNDPTSTEHLKIIINEDLLKGADGPSGQMMTIGNRWLNERNQYEELVSGRKTVTWTSEAGMVTTALVLEAIIDPACCAELRQIAIQASRDLPPACDWYLRLAQPKTATVGQLIALIELAPIAKEDARIWNLAADERRSAQRKSIFLNGALAFPFIGLFAYTVYFYVTIPRSQWESTRGSLVQLRGHDGQRVLVLVRDADGLGGEPGRVLYRDHDLIRGVVIASNCLIEVGAQLTSGNGKLNMAPLSYEYTQRTPKACHGKAIDPKGLELNFVPTSKK